MDYQNDPAGDALARARADYQNNPDPSFLTYGPRRGAKC